MTDTHMSSTFLHYGDIDANGIRQHYLRYGGAAGSRVHRDAVVLVPGSTSLAASWAFVGERFGRHFDTYVLDVRGRGLPGSAPQADASAPPPDDLEAQAADLVAFAAALGLAHWAVVGHSQGATLAAHAAALKPPGLNRLALIDPPVSGGIHADLSRLSVPVLLVTAERDSLVSEDDVFEMEIEMPGLTEVRVADAGHMIPWDNEEGFYQAFGAFLGATLDP